MIVDGAVFGPPWEMTNGRFDAEGCKCKSYMLYEYCIHQNE